MAVDIADELQSLFNLRDQRTAAIEQFILAEAELQGNMQQNAGKSFIGIDDLNITHKLLQPVLDLKQRLEQINQQFEEKKRFFISLLEASGCSKLHCKNKEVNANGQVEMVPYVVTLTRNTDGEEELVIHPH